jgi:predicted ribosomally synthesized peptide with nif11-like leader
MAIQDALEFLRAARRDEALRRDLEAADDGGTEDLVRVAARAGFHFTPDELRRAHVLDWQMRWARYRATD